MHNKQNQKNSVHHNQRIKSLFEHRICSKAVFRGQQQRGAKDPGEKKSFVGCEGVISHFSFLFVITAIFVSYALDKKGDFYIY